MVNIGAPLAPVAVSYPGNANGTTLDYLHNINHNPLDTGDNLSIPVNQSGYTQTWWGFPTWRETLSMSWADPTVQVNFGPGTPLGMPFPQGYGQPFGLAYHQASVVPANTLQLLPDMTTLYRNNSQPYNDGLPANTNPPNPANFVPNAFFPVTGGSPPPLWSQYGWEDDLIMTGVRSFDIKAYDDLYAGYVDLGWGDDTRITTVLNPNPPPQYISNPIFFNGAGTPNTAPFLLGNTIPVWSNNIKQFDIVQGTFAPRGAHAAAHRG